MYCVGLTGTIASGKTTVATCFNTLGIDVINADDIAKQLTQQDGHVLNTIREHFGPSFFFPSGELNRRALRHHIMDHPMDRVWLEDLLHPLIRKGIEQRVTESQSPYCVIEIPLLTNRDHYPYLNRLLVIQTNADEQRQRLMARDHCSLEQANAVINTQWQYHQRDTLADDIILNNGTPADLEQQVHELHREYLLQASS